MRADPTLTVTSDFTEKFNEAIKSFKRDAVLVGIPATEDNRDEEAPIGNAALLAINNFGSPANNIPARPVMANGIRNAQDGIAEEFKKAAQDVLKKGPAALATYYERAGSIAANSVKKAINDQDFAGGGPNNEEPAPATLAARKYLTQAGFKGTKSLIVTGQMRNAITYVVRSVWGR